ncbi:MAG: hypothetical protein V4686_01450 [Patescibacteria group bacterium]
MLQDEDIVQVEENIPVYITQHQPSRAVLFLIKTGIAKTEEVATILLYVVMAVLLIISAVLSMRALEEPLTFDPNDVHPVGTPLQ